MECETLVRDLRKILPPCALRHLPEELAPYECDGLTAYRQRPRLVVLPETREQLQKVIRYCFQNEIPLVPRGAGTGLSAGALPHPEGILLVLSRLDRILEIDPKNRLARVEVGVRNLAISEAAAPFGLHYAPDPSSQIACTIGGNVAENAGGIHCLKYGLTVHNVLAVKAFTAEGDPVEVEVDGVGPDLLALLHGSEGLLAVLYEVTVRLLPKPEAVATLMAAFGGVEEAAEAVAALIRSGLIPAALEMMDHLAIVAVEEAFRVGYPKEAAAVLLCEVDGPRAQTEAEASLAEAVLRQQGAFLVRWAKDERERRRLWAGRKKAFPAIGRMTPDYYCMDGTIPRHKIGEVLRGIERLSRKYGLRVANVFHAGDGNLHPLILYDAEKPGELEKTQKLGEEILLLCIEAGGTITGEHGVGVEKLGPMCGQFTLEELAQFHRVKEAFDPKNILNPGKAIPTLSRCVEWGGMHVHRGKIPFANLERF